MTSSHGESSGTLQGITMGELHEAARGAIALWRALDHLVRSWASSPRLAPVQKMWTVLGASGTMAGEEPECAKMKGPTAAK